MFNKVDFANILKKINSLYENQTQFANASGVNRTYLSQYMNLKLDTPPSPKILKGIANASKGLTTYDDLMKIFGGDMITKIILEASNVNSVNDKDAVKVDLEDDGRVIIYHTDAAIIAKTRKMIEDVAREVEEGTIYTGRVVKVEDFGCFVELWPGCEGLVHVSELDHKRVDKPKDIVRVGDKILVKALGYDNRGRLNLSRKQALPKPDKKDDKKKK